MHNMSLNSALKKPVNVTCKIMHSGQLGGLHVGVLFGVVNNHTVPLLTGTSIIDKFFKEMFPMESKIVTIRSRPFKITLEYTPPSDRLAVLHYSPDGNTITDDQEDNYARTPWFRVPKCVALVPIKEAFVLVTISSAGLINIVLHPNST